MVEAKRLKVCSNVEKCAEFKNRPIHNSAMRNGIPPGYAISQNNAKSGGPLQVYNFIHVILVVKCKFWQQTTYNGQSSILNKN